MNHRYLDIYEIEMVQYFYIIKESKNQIFSYSKVPTKSKGKASEIKGGRGKKGRHVDFLVS